MSHHEGMDIMEIAEKSRDSANVKRVFGDPVQHGDVVVIPVARIAYGGGGGTGQGEDKKGDSGSGSGVGYGVAATPAGVFVVKDGEVRWQPAVDVNRIVVERPDRRRGAPADAARRLQAPPSPPSLTPGVGQRLRAPRFR
ncbi:GerW family sporulation protein [Nonomuraea ferruginea]